jgi:hypothetical protein
LLGHAKCRVKIRGGSQKAQVQARNPNGNG